MDGAHTHGSSGGGAPVVLLAVVVVVIAAIARPVAAAADAVLRVIVEVVEVVAIVAGAVAGLAVLSAAVWLAIRVATSPAGRRARASVRAVAARRSTGRTVPRTRVIIASPTGGLAVREPPLALAVGARLGSRLGSRRAISVDRQDVEQLRDYALTAGRKRGGPAGTGLSTRSVRLMLQQLSAAFEQACDDGKLTRNPARKVTPPRLVRTERPTWGEAEVRQFLAVTDGDRLAAVWRLSLYGLRRGEALGLRWADVDLDAGLLTIASTRVLAAYQVVEKGPKSKKGRRTLPLDATEVGMLRALRKCQAAERLGAGPAYESSGYVAVDELGAPLHPEWFSDEFHRLRVRAGLPRITLHDSRHTATSLMAAAGVPVHIRSAWCGHTESVNSQVYTHARPEDLTVALGALTRVSEGM